MRFVRSALAFHCWVPGSIPVVEGYDHQLWQGLSFLSGVSDASGFPPPIQATSQPKAERKEHQLQAVCTLYVMYDVYARTKMKLISKTPENAGSCSTASRSVSQTVSHLCGMFSLRMPFTMYTVPKFTLTVFQISISFHKSNRLRILTNTDIQGGH